MLVVNIVLVTPVGQVEVVGGCRELAGESVDLLDTGHNAQRFAAHPYL